MTSDPPSPLLRVRDLTIAFEAQDRQHSPVTAVDTVSFDIAPQEVVAVVGESGSGKSVTALALTRLLPTPPARFLSGDILYQGLSTLRMTSTELRRLRGKEIAYIFQEPSASLNPVMSIGAQVREAIILHQPDRRDVSAEIIHLLDEVGIRSPEKRVANYPHELSGGMQQRVMIAMALACRPRLLIADEPTTSLDVTIQKQIIDLLKAIQRQRQMAIMMITHNFGLVHGFSDRVIVMFRGKIVETGPTETVLRNPQHPYTRALMNCIPRLGAHQHRLSVIDHANLIQNLT